MFFETKKTKQHKNYKTANSGFKTKENIVELYVGDYIMDYKMAFWKNDPNIKKIYLAGFDGYSLDEPNQDESFEMIESLKKKYSIKNFNFYSLTKTKLNIKKINLNKI